MIGKGKHVLVVDDMESIRLLLAEELEHDGFVVVQARDEVHALGELRRHHFDAVIIDYHEPNLNGLDLIRQSQMAWP